MAGGAAARYILRAEIGRGGVAIVHEAYDQLTEQRIALKRILPRKNAQDRQRVIELFEREFHTLVQLSHPRIVAVHDYAVDALGPFYTMELLDGGDLQQLVPVDWRRACAVARDACSALSLLHSRRMVHRDVSARNIRCTGDGLAKLIDFGAMVPMGASKHTVVGTPPYASPEVVQGMTLDARTDLYSLGATLYLALTGRHAYPARSFEDLHQRWQCAPPAPSEFTPGIPASLDGLVLDLIQLDPAARPASAAEVIERLSAIDGNPTGEHLLVAQAYLSTPVLVGRGAEFALACKRIRRMQRSRGSAILVEGTAGVGRSRFLDACALDAKLRGAIVLRADGDDAQAGSYGVARALARAAIAAMETDAVPEAGGNLRLLAEVVPELAEHSEDAPPELTETVASRGDLQAALRDWFIALSRKKPLFIAVDDLHRIDEPSMAWLAVLSQQLGPHAIFLMTTSETGASTPSFLALKLLRESATQIALENLGTPETEKLLGSVFGEVPNLGLVASRIHEVSAGNPRDTLRLAQHLVDRGVVRYGAGAWTLPGRFESLDLPSSMAQALATRVASLGTSARELAAALSLSSDLTATFEECLLLTDQQRPAVLVASLDELLRAEILRKAGAGYELAQRVWAPILLQNMHGARLRELHLRVARLYERRGNEPFRMARHLIRGAEETDGPDAVAARTRALEELTRRTPEDLFGFIQSLPADWFETYDEAIRLCEKLNRPKKEQYLLRGRLSALVSVGGTTDRIHLPALVEQLCDDSGLSDYAKLEGLDEATRLMTALGKANERYAATPEQDRVLPPPKAIHQLARVLIQTSAVFTSALDLTGSKTLPSLAPLIPLSPALGVIDLMIKGMIARMTGRVEQAQGLYAKVLARTAEPDRAGLDPSHNTNMRCGLMSGLGMIEAGMGLSSSLDWADRIEAEPLYQVNALHIRMLHHLWQGNIREAVRCKHRVDLLRIQRSAQQFFEGTHLIWQIAAHAIAADLTRTRQTIDEIELVCQRYPGWTPVRNYGRGEYHRIRGDLDSALAAFARGLEATDAGEHQMWAYLAGGQLHTLHGLRRDEEALVRGEEYLAAAGAAGLGYLKHYISMPLSLVQASLGECDAAVETSEGVIASLEALGSTGLNLGLAYETRARVAMLLQDVASFDRYAALFKETFRTTRNASLAARFQKLSRDGQTVWAGAVISDRTTWGERFSSMPAVSMLQTCRSASERAQCALACLAEATEASEGYLFLLSTDGVSCVAQLGDRELPAEIRSLAEEYLAGQSRKLETLTGTASGSTSRFGHEWRVTPDGDVFRPVLLSHSVNEGMAIAGVAVLALPERMPFIIPARLATELSRQVALSGDVSTLVVAG